MSFTFSETDLEGVKYIESDEFADERGYFAEVYKGSEFTEAGIDERFVQINHSYSKKDVLRGLHYQLNPHAQGKLMTVYTGEIFDVAVDIRKESANYGKWVGKKLSADKHNMLYVPEGFAHGFVVLSDEADVVYYCTAEYNKESERGIIWNDEEIGVEWPVDAPVLSDKDQLLPALSDAENNF